MVEMTARPEKPSAWRVKNTCFNFFHFLIQLKLTTKQVPQGDIEKMIRRCRSTYSKSSGYTQPLFEDNY